MSENILSLQTQTIIYYIVTHLQIIKAFDKIFSLFLLFFFSRSRYFMI